MASTATASIYDTITNQIIAALERGTGDYAHAMNWAMT
jgi:antirestriction protein ArdC